MSRKHEEADKMFYCAMEFYPQYVVDELIEFDEKNYSQKDFCS